jgi:hypothetical protein
VIAPVTLRITPGIWPNKKIHLETNKEHLFSQFSIPLLFRQ